MRYATVCSGIEAPSVAWHPLGWEPQWFSEIDAFPSAVLKHHYPQVLNLGDMTKILERDDVKNQSIDLFCGGTPCQSFSVAGLRKGLADPRGNLALVFLGIVDQLRPRWVIWENVPGVLSSNKGRDFGAFVGALGQLGYGWAYRILDAQYFGVPQRRRRVFVVGYIGDWRPAAAVLFERHSLSGHPAPRREKGKGFAADVAPGLTASGRGVERTGESRGQDPVVAVLPETTGTMTANWYKGVGNTQVEMGVCIPVHVFDPNQITSKANRSVPKPELCHTLPASSTPPVAFQSKASHQQSMNPSAISPTLDRCKADGMCVAYGLDEEQNGAEELFGTLKARRDEGAVGVFFAGQGAKAGSIAYSEEVSPTLKASNSGTNQAPTIQQGFAVRRLMPVECERLQGFPDNYTRIPWRGKPDEQCPDGPRYKALGNSMAVPVMEWLGRRIEMIDTQIVNLKTN